MRNEVKTKASSRRDVPLKGSFAIASSLELTWPPLLLRSG